MLVSADEIDCSPQLMSSTGIATLNNARIDQPADGARRARASGHA